MFRVQTIDLWPALVLRVSFVGSNSPIATNSLRRLRIDESVAGQVLPQVRAYTLTNSSSVIAISISKHCNKRYCNGVTSTMELAALCEVQGSVARACALFVMFDLDVALA